MPLELYLFFKRIDKLLPCLGRDDRAELDRRVVGDRDDVAVQLRVEDADRGEAVRDRVGDGAGDRQAGRTIQQDGPAARQFAGSVHLGQACDGVADDLVIRGRSAEADLQDVGGTGDVESAHGGLLRGCSP